MVGLKNFQTLYRRTICEHSLQECCSTAILRAAWCSQALCQALAN